MNLLKRAKRLMAMGSHSILLEVVSSAIHQGKGQHKNDNKLPWEMDRFFFSDAQTMQVLQAILLHPALYVRLLLAMHTRAISATKIFMYFVAEHLEGKGQKGMGKQYAAHRVTKIYGIINVMTEKRMHSVHDFNKVNHQ